ncbi:MAG: SH3 domain-containing protein [Deltaproteobacteria bacterium]
MIRLTLILAVCMFAAFQIFGREMSAEEKARNQPAPNASAGQAPLVVPDDNATTPVVLDPSRQPDFAPISDARVISEETVTRPVAPSEPLDQPTPNPNVVIDPADPVDDGQVLGDPAPQITPETWYVTGDQVNVRAGQGTEFAVVTQVYFAEPVTILTSVDAEWVQIRLTDGTEAWLAARFLSPVSPQQ